MTFTESNTVEQMILDAVTRASGTARFALRQDPPGYGQALGGELRPAPWDYLPATQLPRQPSDAMVSHGCVKRSSA
jgi:hypothetical protein